MHISIATVQIRSVWLIINLRLEYDKKLKQAVVKAPRPGIRIPGTIVCIDDLLMGAHA